MAGPGGIQPRVEESLSWLGKTIQKSVIFSHNSDILALFEKILLLTGKIKNTKLVALELAESLYHNFVSSLIAKMYTSITEIW